MTDDELLGMSVDSLRLQLRPAHALQNAGIKTVGELIGWSSNDLFQVKNCGRKSIKLIQESLLAVGLSLRGEGATAHCLVQIRKWSAQLAARRDELIAAGFTRSEAIGILEHVAHRDASR